LAFISGHCVKPCYGLGAQGPDVRCFTFLRDPAARYLSHRHDRARVYDRDAFDKWVSSSWTQNWQTMKIAGVPDADRAIEIKQQRIGFVGLTERFDESLLLLGQWLAEPDFRVEYRRISQLPQKRRPRDIVREQTDTGYLKPGGVLPRPMRRTRRCTTTLLCSQACVAVPEIFFRVERLA
jgi:hypothetical protein